MNPDTSIDAADGRGGMEDFRRKPGMEGDRSPDVPTAVPCGCAADRVRAVRHRAGLYADCGGEPGGRAEPPSNAMADSGEAFRG